MKRTDFTMLLIDTSGEGTWTEDISCVLDPNETALQRAKRIIKDYNSYLAPNEHMRRVISVRILKEPKPGMFLKHNWERDYVSIQHGYERMKCTQCGATGIKHKAGFTNVDREFIQYEFSCPNKIITKKK